MMYQGAIDPITLEVICQGLLATAREMRVNVIRTAYSSVISQGHDFSCAMFNGRGEMVAAEGLAGHVIPISWSLKHILGEFENDLYPGDVIALNDPSKGGTHKNDVMVAYPIFLDGSLFMFPAIRAHWVDIGGMTPGSISGLVTDTFQEGLMIPPIKIYERGRLNATALSLILNNIRLSDERKGDFMACIGACRNAESRIRDMVRKYGRETVEEAISINLSRSEERMRMKLAEIPRGEYWAEEYIESFIDGNLLPIPIKLTLVVESGSVSADFTGSSSQIPAPVNASLAVSAGGVFLAFKSVLDPDSPINDGTFRPIRVLAPERTVVNAQPPAPFGSFSDVRKKCTSATLAALAKVIPHLVAADQHGTIFHNMIGGVNPRTSREFVYYEFPPGGCGAWCGNDGSDVFPPHDEGDVSGIQSVELLENEFPLFVEESTVRENSGGDGEFRGGMGLRRRIRFLTREGLYSILASRSVVPPYGLSGGSSGAPNRSFIMRNGVPIEFETPGKLSGFKIVRDDELILESSGGGGFGDPLKRGVEQVRDDVLDGYVSIEKARSVYGVFFRNENGEVDSAATLKIRSEGKGAGLRFRVTHVSEKMCCVGELGIRVCLIDSDVAGEICVGDGDLVEFLGAGSAPLRAWVQVKKERGPGRTIPLDERGMKILGVAEGDTIYLRKVSVHDGTVLLSA